VFEQVDAPARLRRFVLAAQVHGSDHVNERDVPFLEQKNFKPIVEHKEPGRFLGPERAGEPKAEGGNKNWKQEGCRRDWLLAGLSFQAIHDIGSSNYKQILYQKPFQG
jgi:hypothetical protein